MMLCTELPSAATIPIASTNSGNAMIVSTMRPTMRSVQPPKKPAESPAKVPIPNASATEPGRDDDAAENVAAELVGAEPMQRRGAGQGMGRVAGERIIGHQRRAKS